MSASSSTKLQTGFAKQWSPELRKSGFTQVSNLFLESYSRMTPEITHSEAIFIIHLMQFKWTERSPFPSYRRLADRMGVTEISIKRYARAMEKKGYLQRAKRTGRTNVFHLTGLIDQLNAIATHQVILDDPPDAGGRGSPEFPNTMPQPLENP